MMTIVCLEPTGAIYKIIFRNVLKFKANHFPTVFYHNQGMRITHALYQIKSNKISVFQISILSMVLFVHNEIYGYAG